METHLRHAQSFKAVPLPCCCCYRCRSLRDSAEILIPPYIPLTALPANPRQNGNPMSVTPSQRSAPRAWISLHVPDSSPIGMTFLRHTPELSKLAHCSVL